MQPLSDDATPEQRARAVRFWEDVVRPEMNIRESAKPTETPLEALERLKERAKTPVTIGAGLAKILAGMRKARAT